MKKFEEYSSIRKIWVHNIAHFLRKEMQLISQQFHSKYIKLVGQHYYVRLE